MTTPYSVDPEEVNRYHSSSDVDVGPFSQHHTLGKAAGQAASGSHLHNGSDSFGVPAGSGLVPISYPADVMGDMLIVLTDGSATYSRLPRGANRTYPMTDPVLTPGIKYVQQPGTLAPVQAVATTNVSINTPGALTVDGVSLVTGDRVLLVAQTTGTENGIYNFLGSGTALQTAADVALTSSLYSGMDVTCTQGTNYAATNWRLRNPQSVITSAQTQSWGLAPGYKVQASTAASSTTTATAFGNLADAVTTSVTVWLGALQTVQVIVSAEVSVTTGGSPHASQLTFSVSGTETVAASVTNNGLECLSAIPITQERTSLLTTSNATGNRTFTLAYRTFTGGDTSTFGLRRIIVMT